MNPSFLTVLQYCNCKVLNLVNKIREMCPLKHTVHHSQYVISNQWDLSLQRVETKRNLMGIFKQQ